MGETPSKNNSELNRKKIITPNSEPVQVNLSAIEAIMVLTQFTSNLFGSFPPELILFVIEFYESLVRVKILLGTGNFIYVRAGNHEFGLYIVDQRTKSWIALPVRSNGYFVHSPDGKNCGVWLRENCEDFDEELPSHPMFRPNGKEVKCVNDPEWKSMMDKFWHWDKWEEKDNVVTFSSSDLNAPYKVEINLGSYSSDNWKYYVDDGPLVISHDGLLPKNYVKKERPKYYED
jgi:hypothetical protein